MPKKSFDIQTPTALRLKHFFKQLNCGKGFNNSHLDFPNDLSHTLEYKHLLANFLQAHHCPFIPETYEIDDGNYLEVLNGLKHLANGWILKPSLLNNGQHIHLFPNRDAVLLHYLQSNRMGGPHVLQAYIDPPHLLKGPSMGHKYSIRMFMLLTLPFGAYLYPDGYFNIALKPYDKDVKESQLTNEHLSPDTCNVVQIPTFQYPLFLSIFPKILEACHFLMTHFRSHVDAYAIAPFKMAFLGLDFMLDASEKLYLLEMNHGPCFPIHDNHPLQKKLYDGLWQSLVLEVIEPLLKHEAVCLKRWLQVGDSLY
jgi:tubulin--tyrosine ligase